MPRILLADDHLAQLTLWSAVLEAAGHHMDAAISAADALSRLERRAVDLVIMDLRFPNPAGEPDSAEGLALIRGIRGSGCGVPIVVLSGWPEDLYGRPEERLVSRVMVKPVAAAELLEAVRELAG